MMDISISSGFLLSLWWRELFSFGVCFGLVSWGAVRLMCFIVAPNFRACFPSRLDSPSSSTATALAADSGSVCPINR